MSQADNRKEKGMLRVVQIIDSLTTGGSEMVAVNIANALAEMPGIKSHLVVTRKPGSLQQKISDKVGQLYLEKRRVIDVRAIWRLARYIKRHKINIVHAHSTSYFFPVLIKWATGIKIVWHDHYGEKILPSGRRPYPYIGLSYFFDFVFCVSEPLLKNAQKHLNVPLEKIQYLPNFSILNATTPQEVLAKPNATHILAMVANIRPQKDHENMIRALSMVKEIIPDVHLFAIGIINSQDDVKHLLELAAKLGVAENITFTGEVANIQQYLALANLGVLSSKSEGLPLSLIEYGLASLPVVCTHVGQCSSVLKGGEYGWLVPPSDARRLAEAIVTALSSPAVARQKALAFHQFVEANYSQQAVMGKILKCYEQLVKK